MRATDWLGRDYGVGDLVIYAAGSGRSITMILGRVVGMWIAVYRDGWVRLAEGELPGQNEKAALRVRVQPVKSSRWKHHAARGYYVDTRSGDRIDPWRNRKHIKEEGHYRDRTTHERVEYGHLRGRIGYFTEAGRKVDYLDYEYVSTVFQSWVEHRHEDGPRPVTLLITENIVRWDGELPDGE